MPEGTLPTVSAIQQNNSSNICTYCGLQINDQYIFKVAPDQQWHEKCLKCIECNKFLDENSKCYIKDNKAYCKDDYLRLFSLKCYRCGLMLKRNDMVMKCKTLIYHYDCFNCDICNKRLLPGDEFLIKDNNLLICKEDSLNELRILSTSTPSTTTTTTTAVTTTTTTSTQSLSININSNSNSYRNSLINSDDSSFSPSVSSSSIESLVPTVPASTTTTTTMITNYERTSYSPSIIFYSNSNDYNYQSIQDDDSEDIDDDTSSEKEFNMNFNKQQHHQHHHHHHHQAQLNQHNFSSSSSSSTNKNSYNSHSKPARIRTVLNEKQLHTLRACYGANPRPDALMKEQLVEMTGLSPRVIRVWFQNKRCKDKKKTLLNRQVDPNILSQTQHQHSQHVIFERCF